MPWRRIHPARMLLVALLARALSACSAVSLGGASATATAPALVCAVQVSGTARSTSLEVACTVTHAPSSETDFRLHVTVTTRTNSGNQTTISSTTFPNLKDQCAGHLTHGGGACFHTYVISLCSASGSVAEMLDVSVAGNLEPSGQALETATAIPAVPAGRNTDAVLPQKC